MKNAGKFYGYLEYYMVIWFILWQFGNVMVIWYIFPRFGILCQEKSGNPGSMHYFGGRALLFLIRTFTFTAVHTQLRLRGVVWQTCKKSR
jgi:hypothetical protein